MNWDKFRENIIPIIALVGIIGAGIASLILAVYHPDCEWLKEIAFFIFGSGTGPLFNLINFKTSPTINGMISKMLIGGIIGLGMAQVGCAEIGLNAPETTVNVVYENGKTCVVLETKVCYEGTEFDLPVSCPNKDI